MSAERPRGPLVGRRARRLELARAKLAVQRERVALTVGFMRLAVKCPPRAVETLVVSQLRLQRAVERAQDVALTYPTTASDYASYTRPESPTERHFRPRAIPTRPDTVIDMKNQGHSK